MRDKGGGINFRLLLDVEGLSGGSGECQECWPDFGDLLADRQEDSRTTSTGCLDCSETLLETPELTPLVE